MTQASFSHSLHPFKDPKQLCWGLGCIVLLVLLFAADAFLKQSDKHEHDAKTEISQQDEINFEVLSHNVLAMQLSNVNLPSVPKHLKPDNSAVAEANQPAQGRSNIQPTHKTEKHLQASAPQANKLENTNIDTDVVNTAKSADVSESLINYTMGKLSSVPMQIALPAAAFARESVIEFLHNCVGVGLAAVSSQGEVKQLMPLSALPKDASPILRQVSGEMGVKEYQLKQAYAPKQNIIRVYPTEFDRQLSAYIAQNLQGESLQQFYAEYHLQQNTLSLTNIRLNQRALAQTWLLFDGFQHSCRL